jgi:hypothetical protein
MFALVFRPSDDFADLLTVRGEHRKTNEQDRGTCTRLRVHLLSLPWQRREGNSDQNCQEHLRHGYGLRPWDRITSGISASDEFNRLTTSR